MGGDLFDAHLKSIGPVRGENEPWNVDPFFLRICPYEFGINRKIFLQQIDMKEGGGVVAVPKEFYPLFLGKLFPVVPVF